MQWLFRLIAASSEVQVEAVRRRVIQQRPEGGGKGEKKHHPVYHLVGRGTSDPCLYNGTLAQNLSNDYKKFEPPHLKNRVLSHLMLNITKYIDI